jgi:hypothetical protein
MLMGLILFASELDSLLFYTPLQSEYPFVYSNFFVLRANPEVIFLQEMVHDLMARLKNLLENMYNIFVSDENDPYFCVTLVSKNISILRQEVSKFANSQMYRSFTCVEVKLKLLLYFY